MKINFLLIFFISFSIIGYSQSDSTEIPSIFKQGISLDCSSSRTSSSLLFLDGKKYKIIEKYENGNVRKIADLTKNEKKIKAWIILSDDSLGRSMIIDRKEYFLRKKFH